MKNRINNKGFTLVELIIAIAILSIVLGLGYKVIIGTNKATKHQTQVFSEQQNANLINKYLTKDLEQAIEFTPADTTSNPYTYVINDGVSGTEKIEYKVEKTPDGKFYDLTRIAGSTSIKLISNYPTSSEVPFSISQVEKSDSTNIFKVILNGKGKDYEVGKYEFEVTSRVEVIEIEDGDTGPGSGDTGPGSGDTGPGSGDTGPGSGDTGPGAGDTGPEDGDTGPGAGDTGPEDGNEGTGVTYNASLDFTFDKSKQGTDYTVNTIASIFTSHNQEKRNDTYSKTQKITGNNKNTYDIEVTIPVKNSNHLGISVNKFGMNRILEWDEFKDIVNDGIRIYGGANARINSVKLDGDEVKIGSDGRYYISLNELNQQNQQNPISVNLSLNVSILDFSQERFISIQFGKYYD